MKQELILKLAMEEGRCGLWKEEGVGSCPRKLGFQ